MNRRIRLLAGLSATVGVTLLVAWILVQALVIRPGIGAREQARIQVALDGAEQMGRGAEKRALEAERGIDLRLFDGDAASPPPGEGWIRQETSRGTVWKREGGKYDIAAWSGEQWVVLHVDLPVASTLALAFAAGGLPVVFVMFGVFQRSQRHQERAEAALDRMAAGDLAERLDETSGGAEVRRIASSVNRMAEQLQSLLESDRQRMAGLSHELRTPLTRIRLELELARRDGASPARLDRVERDIEAFDSLLSEMLELSRLELGGEQQLERETVDLAGLAAWVVDEEGWADVTLGGTGTAFVDARLVGRLVGNLVRNSAQHAPAARRWVEVSDDVVVVGDDGPGMPVDHPAREFRAFRRGEASTGHGLGLAIVRQIAVLHGATVTLSQPPGLVVEVRFPTADPS